MPNPSYPPKSGGPAPTRSASTGRGLTGAHAPYNFVPLPEHVAGWQGPPSADRYHPDRYTGWLDLTITAETPLYLRGTVGPDELTGREPRPEFFSPTGRPAIPGSSLRGMLRTLVEIVSASAMDMVSNEHYVYRAVAERRDSALTGLYRRRLQQVRAGYLLRVGGALRIVPARRLGGQQYWRVSLDVAGRGLRRNFRDHPFERHRVAFRPDAAASDPRRTPLVSDLATAGSDAAAGWADGWLVVSGPMENKRHAWIVADPDLQAAPTGISSDDERAHRAGWSPRLEELHRQGQFPLLPEGSTLLPCFFASWQDEAGRTRVAWGHTRWFRVPYEHGVGSRMPARAHSPVWDIAKAIFGRAGQDREAWAGRAFVEDAPLVGDPVTSSDDVGLPSVLSGPKPTTFQHYLQQGQALQSGSRADLRHWDADGAAIRGYKLFWHRPGAEWRDRERPPEGDSQGKPIQPLRPGSRFQGRLRFENLAAEELGALLFVLHLPNGCHHRIGMAKPLGLGSISIGASLHLDDRTARYTRLFATDASGATVWAVPARNEDTTPEQIQRAFASWVLSQQAEAEQSESTDVVSAAWRIPRLRSLQALLSWRNAPDLSRTSYMRIEPNEFSGRPALPDALTVIGWQSPGGPRDDVRPLPATGLIGPSPAPPSDSPRPPTQAPQVPGVAPSHERAGESRTMSDSDLEALRQMLSPKPVVVPKQPARTRRDERAREEQRRILDDLRRPKPR